MRQAFGDCLFDRDRRELTHSGEAVHCGPKLLALLELLLDAAPRVLTKDEIHKALWPDTFISDATLTSLVAELRAAIGDAARAPRLIRLAVLIDRGRREFPIAADYVGLHVTETAAEAKVRVRLMPTDREDGVYLVEDAS